MKPEPEHGTPMGIRFSCPNGHRLHVKEDLAGKRGLCPNCGAKVLIPTAEQVEEPAAVAAQGTQAVAHPPQRTAADALPLNRRLPPAAAATFPTAATSDLPTGATAKEPLADENPAVEAPAPVAVAPPSPVSKYVASRTRARRNQTTIALLLLMAVLLLAAVLVWVLQRGPAAAGPSEVSMEVGFNRGLPPAAEVRHTLT
jgi:hypothetical protein